jgi:hypothetical protein
MRRFVSTLDWLFAVFALFSIGCTSTRIGTATHYYAYVEARTEDAAPSQPCRDALLSCLRAIQEANAASKTPGTIPLQMNALHETLAKVKEECKTWIKMLPAPAPR